MSRRRIGFWYRLAAAIAKPPLIVLFKRDWRGMENIPAEGGFLTAVNHNSYLDPLLYAHFQYNTGRLPRFLAKAALFKPFFVGAVMRGTGQIPVVRATADAAAAYRSAVEAVNNGECVAFYPEGTLTRDPDLWPMVGKTGIARVALLTGAPVIPIAQWGANEFLPPYAKKPSFLPRKTHRVLVGTPVDLSAWEGKDPTAEVLREVTGAIMADVKQLLAEVRGIPAPDGLYDPRKADKADKEAGGKDGNGAKGAGDTGAGTAGDNGDNGLAADVPGGDNGKGAA
ncbi:1-acyl-sn-glycerol-3-phosphate acyltransferases [Actinacidiphila yanglinensis]|uniref:1-acyl-sn-glycerol-3-phosphate acyltransferases n=1 Tax=Actinacidiphila yanglinensis TaxID=310779 RepID=A0A1H6E4I3_9ACTN|nr:lysophospholipid acyltransferase family protein [Actinacidiphila yanglinensis]SEG92527.1 1-acyl-sn-glycerol-3-phosphate acyltransferases [Actinacidiphila yanglinensis]